MEGNQTMLDPPEVRSLSLSHLLSAGPWSPGQACADACSCAQAANVTSGRITEKEVKSFAFDKSYWCVPLAHRASRCVALQISRAV